MTSTYHPSSPVSSADSTPYRSHESEWIPPQTSNLPLHPPVPIIIPNTVEQPFTSPASSSSDQDGIPAPLCAGCRLRIVDKFYLSSVERKWHAACLKCSECGGELEDQMSCYEREGHIYCKDDYHRIYNNRQCSKCCLEIQSSDLVMKARNSLFHIACFRCTSCDIPLQKGDLFGMFEDGLYCKEHYEQIRPQPEDNSYESNYDHYPNHESSMSPWGYPPPPEGWYPPPPNDGGYMPGPSDYLFDNNNDPIQKKRRGRKKRKIETFSAAAAAAAANGGYLDPTTGFPSPTGGSGGPLDGGPKTKRARTSFKHHQLRIMKAHFQINQNPDSRDLKSLSQKTGLDKKILQVWFQNSRAKWRRTKSTEGGGNPSNLPPPGMGPPMDGDQGMGMDASSPSSECSGNMIPCC